MITSIIRFAAFI